MIQNIAPEVFHNQFVDRDRIAPELTDTVFAYDGRTVLVKHEAENDPESPLVFPTAGEVISRGFPAASLLYLFSIETGAASETGTAPQEAASGETIRVKDENGGNAGAQEKAPDTAGGSVKHFFLFRSFDAGNTPLELDGYHYEKTYVLRSIRPKDMCFAAVTGYHLYVWYRDNRFCGRCRTKMDYSHKERALICPKCHNTVYPRLNPAVIVGVIRGDSILMTRYAGREYKGHALIAGFCEIGETFEETVQREVMEEVGLHVHNIRYYKSQPWGFDSDLLAGFWCDADPDEEITLDRMELAKARFIPREEIGDEEADLSLTAEMIMYFRDKMPRQR